MKSIFALGVVTAMLSGCGPFNTFNGTVGGVALQPNEAIFTDLRDPKDNSIQGAALIMTSGKDVCSTLKANRTQKNTVGVVMAIMRKNADNMILAPDVGEYAILPPKEKVQTNVATQTAGASFNKGDANCNNTLAEAQSLGESGFIKVTEFKTGTNGRMTGTFDITFGSQKDKTTGSFSATYCDATENFYALLNGKKTSCE